MGALLRPAGCQALRLHAGATVAQSPDRGAVGHLHPVLRQATVVRPVSGKNGLGSTLTKFIIPAGETARFRDQLDLVDVDERRLFPDLDGVAAEMRRYYS